MSHTLTQFASPLLYLAGTVAYALHFARGGRTSGRLGTMALALGALLHLFALSPAGSQVIRCPVTNEGGFLSLLALCVVAVYLVLERQFRRRNMGLVMAPFAAFLYFIALALDDPSGSSERLVLFTSGWFGIHVLSSLVAYAAFAFSAVAALMQLILQRAISGAHMGLVFERFPDLRTLDRMTLRSVLVGFPALTIGLVTGALWAIGESRAGWATDPKTLATGLAWLVFGIYLATRGLAGWQGSRSAWTALIGFVVILLTHIASISAFSQFHSFR